MYLGSTYLGPVSTLPYDGWRFKLPGANITISLAVSTSGCVPIVEGIHINDNRKFFGKRKCLLYYKYV